MQYFVIGDSDTVLGFAYASLRGRVAASRQEVLSALDEASRNADVGVIIITEDAAAMARAELDAVRAAQARPLIVEIPGPKGPAPQRRAILNVVTQAVGIRV